jgi:hypothetical protein
MKYICRAARIEAEVGRAAEIEEGEQVEQLPTWHIHL